MISENLGGVCLISESGTVMSTYRFTNDQWNAVKAAFSSSQTDYAAAFPAKIDTSGNPPAALDYMDQYHCE